MTDLVMSNSKQKTAARCMKQFEFKYMMKLKPKRRKVHLEFGSWIHELLMVHYDGEDWREMHAENTKVFMNYFEEEREYLGFDLPDDIARLMRSYLRHYRDEDKHYHTIDSEVDEIITLPNGLKFRFIIDHIYEDSTGGLWLRDHKTVGKGFLDTDFFLLDGQLAKYFWCAVRMGYTPLRGIEFNQLRKKAPTIPPLTKKTGKISTAKKYDTDYWTFLKAIKDYDLDPKDYMPRLRALRADEDRFFRRDRLPVSKALMRNSMKELDLVTRMLLRQVKRGEFPRTPLNSCRFDCDFLDLCQAQFQGGDIGSLIKQNYVRNRREED